MRGDLQIGDRREGERRVPSATRPRWHGLRGVKVEGMRDVRLDLFDDTNHFLLLAPRRKVGEFMGIVLMKRKSDGNALIGPRPRGCPVFGQIRPGANSGFAVRDGVVGE
jgi:hypothetical protein